MATGPGSWTPPGSAGPPQYAPPPQARPPKKISPLIWILVVCVALFAFGLVAIIGGGLFFVHKAKQAGFDPELMKASPGLAITKMIAKENPDLDVLSTDDRSQKITVRDKKTGKVYTMDFDSAQQGKIVVNDGKDKMVISSSGSGSDGHVEITSKDGTFRAGSGVTAKIPSWLPEYPGSTVQATYSSQTNAGDSGNFSFNTKDSATSVLHFYQEHLQTSGLKITSSAVSGGQGGMITAEDDGKEHSAVVIIGSDSGETTVNVTFNAKKK